MADEIDQFRSLDKSSQDDVINSLSDDEVKRLLLLIDKREQGAYDIPVKDLSGEQSLLDKSQSGVESGEIKPAPTTLQSYPLVRDMARGAAGALGAIEGMGAGSALGGAVGTALAPGPGTAAGAIIGGSLGTIGGAAGYSGLAEAGMQGIDALQLAKRGDDPTKAFNFEQLGASAVSGAIEAPVDIMAGPFFGYLGKFIKGRALTTKSANDMLAKAIVGDAAAAYKNLKAGEVVPSDYDSVLKLVEKQWEPIFMAEQPDDLFNAAVDAIKVQPSSKVTAPRISEMTDTEVSDFYRKQWKDVIDEADPDTAAVLARATKGDKGTYDGSLVSEIASLVDNADSEFKRLKIEFNVGKDILPRIGNIKISDGKVNVDELLKSGKNTIVGKAVDYADPDREANARNAAKLIEALIGKTNKEGTSPKVLQELKVKLDQAVSKAHGTSENIPSRKEMQLKFSNLYREMLAKTIQEVDEQAGTQYGAQLAQKRELFGTIKEALPALDRYKAYGKAGLLTERKRIERGIPGGTLGAAAIGGGLGRTAESALGLSGLSVAGATLGAAAATKKLPSRLQRVMIAKRGFGSPATMRDRVVDTTNIFLTGQISRNVSDLFRAGSDQLENTKNAMAVALMKEQGIVDSQGNVQGELPPEFDNELEGQIEQAIAPISEAIRSGDEIDVARAVALVAKQFPSAFPDAEFKGEVELKGKRILPLHEDRMAYSMRLKDDDSLTKTQKAKMRSAVHRNGEIISVPKLKPTAPLKD